MSFLRAIWCLVLVPPPRLLLLFAKTPRQRWRRCFPRDAGWAGGVPRFTVGRQPARGQLCPSPERSWKLVLKKKKIDVLYFGGRLGVCVGFQEALIRSPGGTKSSPALEAQSPAWRISPQPPRGAVGNAAVSYYQCNIFKPIFKWAEGIISRALGPHRPLLPSLLLFFFFSFLGCSGQVQCRSLRDPASV